MSYGSNATAELQEIRAVLLFGHSAGEDAESVGYSNPNLI
jgi:hypothetical protein